MQTSTIPSTRFLPLLRKRGTSSFSGCSSRPLDKGTDLYCVIKLLLCLPISSLLPPDLTTVYAFLPTGFTHVYMSLTVSFPSQQVVFFNIYHPEKLPSVIERFEKEADRVISVLESVLSMQAFLNGDKVTVADLGFISWFVQRRGTRDSLTRANVLLLRALGTSWRTPFSCPRSMSSRPSTRPVRQSFLLPSFALWFHLTDKLLDE